MPNQHHSGLSKSDFLLIVNAVMSHVDYDRSSGRGLVDVDGLRVKVDEILGGLLEQLEALERIARDMAQVLEGNPPWPVPGEGYPELLARYANWYVQTHGAPNPASEPFVDSGGDGGRDGLGL